MDTPGDYYKRKEMEAQEVKAKIEAHTAYCETCATDGYCETRIRLERALERARYMGD